MNKTSVRGEKPEKQGRGAVGKVLAGIVAEDRGKKEFGQIRLDILYDTSAKSLTAFAKERIETGSALRIVADYQVPTVSEKILRIILSYTDYVNRVVWNR